MCSKFLLFSRDFYVGGHIKNHICEFFYAYQIYQGQLIVCRLLILISMEIRIQAHVFVKKVNFLSLRIISNLLLL